MVISKNPLSVIFMASLIVALLLTSCNQKISQSQLLHDLKIDNVEKFASLPVCRQIDVYVIVGSEYLDVGHMIALVPTWMNKEISRQPSQVVANCIVERGKVLLSHLNDDPDQYEKDSFKIHALIYKAIDLNLFDYPEVNSLIHETICDTSVFDKGVLDIFFYIRKYPSLTNYPSVEEMESDLCR